MPASGTGRQYSKQNQSPETYVVAKNRNSFAKLQRDAEKKRKAKTKKDRREQRKAGPSTKPGDSSADAAMGSSGDDRDVAGAGHTAPS